MSMSGIEIDPTIPEMYNDMKMKKTHKWLTFKIENKKRIVLDLAGDPAVTSSKEEDKQIFDELAGHLTLEPRYILYDFGFMNKEKRKIQRLAFIFWCPDDCKIGDKMIYASSKDAIKKTLMGLQDEFQANDAGDFDYDSFSAEIERKA